MEILDKLDTKVISLAHVDSGKHTIINYALTQKGQIRFKDLILFNVILQCKHSVIIRTCTVSLFHLPSISRPVYMLFQ